MIAKTVVVLSAISVTVSLLLFSQYDLGANSPLYVMLRDPPARSPLGGAAYRHARAAAAATADVMRIVYWSNRDLWNFVNTTHRRTCGAHTCEFTLDRGLYNDSDVVVIDVHRLRFFGGLPRWRVARQKWAFLMIETPLRQFTNLDAANDQFNISITYRRDSDVPLPYGQCEPYAAPPGPAVNYAAGKTRTVAWFVSNCDDTDSLRRRYAEELQRYVDVDVYGKCGTMSCDKALGNYCRREVLNKHYKFYLSFENSFCAEYVTEKLWDILPLDVVPVVLGGADYRSLLPPRSYIDVRDFPSARALAKYLALLAADDRLYNAYFAWKRAYRCATYSDDFSCKLCAYVHRHRRDVQRIRSIRDLWSTRDCLTPAQFYKNRI